MEDASDNLDLLTNSLINGTNENEMITLASPETGLTVSDVWHAFKVLIKYVTERTEEIERNSLLSNAVRTTSVQQMRDRVSAVMNILARTVRERHNSVDFDVHLFGLFVSKKEWLALKAIEVSNPCNLIDYQRMYPRMTFSTPRVESAYYDNFMVRASRCPRSGQNQNQMGSGQNQIRSGQNQERSF